MQKFIPADMGIEAHRPRDLRYTWANTSALTHSLRCTKRNIQSHIHAESQIQRHRHQTETEKYVVHTHVDAQRFRHQSWYDTFPRECTNGHGDPQNILEAYREAHGSTSMHVLHTDRKAMHPHWQSPARLHKHSCTDTCVYCHMYACKQKWGQVLQRHTQTERNRDIAEHIGKIPVHTESSNAHSNMSMWTHRCIHHRVIQRHQFSCRLTHTRAHRHEDGHTDIRIQPEVEEQMYEHQGMHV